MNANLVVSCEQGGNRIPATYQALLGSEEMQSMLASRRGFNRGALVMAKDLADRYGASLVSFTTSRRFIDLNRSLGHADLFSSQIRQLVQSTRDHIVDAYYRSFPAALHVLVRERVDVGRRVLHLVYHGFTSELNGEVRRADIGLLAGHTRLLESQFCQGWRMVLAKTIPCLGGRSNSPSQDRNDGVSRDLRRVFPADCYLAIEVEINQKTVTRSNLASRSHREHLWLLR